MSRKKKNISHRVAGFTPSPDQKLRPLLSVLFISYTVLVPHWLFYSFLNSGLLSLLMLNRLYDIQRSAAIFLWMYPFILGNACSLNNLIFSTKWYLLLIHVAYPPIFIVVAVVICFLRDVATHLSFWTRVLFLVNC